MIAKLIRKELDDAHYLEEWELSDGRVFRKEADVTTHGGYIVPGVMGALSCYIDNKPVVYWAMDVAKDGTVKKLSIIS